MNITWWVRRDEHEDMDARAIAKRVHSAYRRLAPEQRPTLVVVSDDPGGEPLFQSLEARFQATGDYNRVALSRADGSFVCGGSEYHNDPASGRAVVLNRATRVETRCDACGANSQTQRPGARCDRPLPAGMGGCVGLSEGRHCRGTMFRVRPPAPAAADAEPSMMHPDLATLAPVTTVTQWRLAFGRKRVPLSRCTDCFGYWPEMPGRDCPRDCKGQLVALGLICSSSAEHTDSTITRLPGETCGRDNRLPPGAAGSPTCLGRLALTEGPIDVAAWQAVRELELPSERAARTGEPPSPQLPSERAAEERAAEWVVNEDAYTHISPNPAGADVLCGNTAVRHQLWLKHYREGRRPGDGDPPLCPGCVAAEVGWHNLGRDTEAEARIERRAAGLRDETEEPFVFLKRTPLVDKGDDEVIGYYNNEDWRLNRDAYTHLSVARGGVRALCTGLPVGHRFALVDYRTKRAEHSPGIILTDPPLCPGCVAAEQAWRKLGGEFTRDPACAIVVCDRCGQSLPTSHVRPSTLCARAVGGHETTVCGGTYNAPDDRPPAAGRVRECDRRRRLDRRGESLMLTAENIEDIRQMRQRLQGRHRDAERGDTSQPPSVISTDCALLGIAVTALTEFLRIHDEREQEKGAD